MKSFYLIYGVLLLMASLAFSYLEVRSKDQRMLKAKVVRAHQLTENQQCQKAFNLLTQRKQPGLQDYYTNQSEGKLNKLKRTLCKALENSVDLKANLLAFQHKKAAPAQEVLFKVSLPAGLGKEQWNLGFARIQGELLLIRVKRKF